MEGGHWEMLMQEGRVGVLPGVNNGSWKLGMWELLSGFALVVVPHKRMRGLLAQPPKSAIILACRIGR